jgi:hypothetical protein
MKLMTAFEPTYQFVASKMEKKAQPLCQATASRRYSPVFVKIYSRPEGGHTGVCHVIYHALDSQMSEL